MKVQLDTRTIDLDKAFNTVTINDLLEALKDTYWSCEVWLMEDDGGWAIDTFSRGSSPIGLSRRVAVMNPENGIQMKKMETSIQHCWDTVLSGWSSQEAWLLMKTVWGLGSTLPFIRYNDQHSRREAIPSYSEGGIAPPEVEGKWMVNGRTIIRDQKGRVYDCHPLGAGGNTGLYPIRWQLDYAEVFQLPGEVWTP